MGLASASAGGGRPAHRRRIEAAEQAEYLAGLSSDDVAFEHLGLGLRKLLRPEKLEGVYLLRPPFARPAKMCATWLGPPTQSGS